jgi:DNA-binding transcriptional ArsR family regulator
MEKKGYYAIIPANVRYDKRITPNAKLLYGELTALSNEKGYCWAGNQYFSDLYEVSKQSISSWIGQLRDAGYIAVQLEYREGTKEILNRYIRILDDPIQDILNTPTNNFGEGIQENLKDNNTINTTSNNTINKGGTPKKTKRFVKPTLDEVTEYCNLRGAGIDPQGFIDFYESKDWMIGKNKMKDWKAAVRTWMRKDRERKQVQPVKQKREPTGLRGRSIAESLADRSWAE